MANSIAFYRSLDNNLILLSTHTSICVHTDTIKNPIYYRSSCCRPSRNVTYTIIPVIKN